MLGSVSPSLPGSPPSASVIGPLTMNPPLPRVPDRVAVVVVVDVVVRVGRDVAGAAGEPDQDPAGVEVGRGQPHR